MNTDQLELRQLRAFLALVEEGTFTDAAIRVGTSQSGLSRSIARLEAAVGVRLVERTTRSVALTAAGTSFYPRVSGVLRLLDEAVAGVRGETRALRLGYAWAAFGRHTSPILREWRERHPDVPLEVHRIEERMAGLTRGLTDVAVIRGEVAPDYLRAEFLHAELLTREGRVAVLPVGHRLATRAAVEIAELNGDPIARISTIGTTTLDLWPPETQPPAVLELDNIDEWLTVIASGAAVGVTPESTPYQHAHAGVVFVPVRSVPPVPVFLMWPQLGAHPGVSELVELVRAHLGRAAGPPPVRVE
jgi:DNA-binding transcriptional LysR family regulator